MALDGYISQSDSHSSVMIPTLHPGYDPDLSDQSRYSASSSYAKMAKEAAASTGKIEVTRSDGNAFVGSGFVVDSNGDMVTACHLSPFDDDNLTVTINGVQHRAHRVTVQDEFGHDLGQQNDLALLRLDKSENESFKPVIFADGIPLRAPRAAFGFPHGSVQMFMSPEASIYGSRMTYLSSLRYDGDPNLPGERRDRKMMQSAMNTAPGNSGGDEFEYFDGLTQFIGTVDKTGTDDMTTFGTPVNTVADFLKKAGITPTFAHDIIGWHQGDSASTAAPESAVSNVSDVSMDVAPPAMSSLSNSPEPVSQSGSELADAKIAYELMMG